MEKPIITCAITGSIHTPTMTPHLPLTPEEITEEAVKAAESGATSVHIHVRDPESGAPSPDLELFKEVLSGIKQRSDVIICPTTGGGLGMGREERIAQVPELKPEVASFNMGSMNVGIYPMARKIDEFKYDWEKQYMESSKDYVFRNTFEDLEFIGKTFRENDTKPELECYDVGHIYNTKRLVDDGFLETPLWMQFVLGILGGIGADIDNLIHMKKTANKLFGDEYEWSVAAAGRYQFPLCTQALLEGGNVRVGLEDNLYVGKGKLAKSNAELVEKIVGIINDMDKGPATPEEGREILGLKGIENVNF